MSFLRSCSLSLLTLSLLVAGSSRQMMAKDNHHPIRKVMVPGEDRFVPFAITVKAGTKVEWTNNDTDDHYLVSNDMFNTPDIRGSIC